MTTHEIDNQTYGIVMDATYLGLPANTRLPVHRHDYCELLLVLLGNLTTIIDGNILTNGPGNAVFHPKGMDHEEIVGDEDLRIAIVSWHISDQSSHLDVPLHVSDRNGIIAVGMRWLVRTWMAYGTCDGQPALHGILQAVLHEYRHLNDNGNDRLISLIHGYVESHMAEPISLDELAAVACMSRSHFASVFRRAAGCSPIEYVNRQRVELARERIITTSRPISIIAREVGFEDSHYFSRIFRKIYGYAPSGDRIIRT